MKPNLSAISPPRAAAPPTPVHVDFGRHACTQCGHADALGGIALAVGAQQPSQLWLKITTGPAASPAVVGLQTPAGSTEKANAAGALSVKRPKHRASKRGIYRAVKPAALAPPKTRTLRQELGLISQRIKAQMGNVARRGLHYGLLVGGLLAAAAAMAAPIVGAYFILPGVIVGAAVPIFLLGGVVIGAAVEVSARQLRKKHLAVDDILALERTYLHLQAKKRRLGKLDGDEQAAWHKVNQMLEELSGGLFRAVRLVATETLGLKRRCGRYQVGSVLPATKALLADDAVG